MKRAVPTRAHTLVDRCTHPGIDADASRRGPIQDRHLPGLRDTLTRIQPCQESSQQLNAVRQYSCNMTDISTFVVLLEDYATGCDNR